MKNTELNIGQLYLETLMKQEQEITFGEWARLFSKDHPDLYEKAHKEAMAQKRPSTGLRELAARMSSMIASGRYDDCVIVNRTQRPMKIKYVSATDKEDIEAEEDEEITREEIIKSDTDKLSVHDLYRIDEMESIIKQLKSYFCLDFELDHAKAIRNKESPGAHHPDNLQLLLKIHNNRKSHKNWDRFSFEEQVEYLKAVISVQQLVSKKMQIEMHEEVIQKIIQRLRLIY